jgi:hypothetical protein
MDQQSGVELKKNIESRLLQKISDLEAVKLSLEEDLRSSVDVEHERNMALLNATNNLLDQLRQAQHNIHGMDPA